MSEGNTTVFAEFRELRHRVVLASFSSISPRLVVIQMRMQVLDVLKIGRTLHST